MSGYLNIDKPVGITSFDVVRAVRRAAHIKRVGHAGTLDPLASGVLPVAIGSHATRLIDAMVDTRKAYTADITLGTETDTDDAEGEAVTTANPAAVVALTDAAIEAALATFEGAQQQLPPAYSAIKRDGQPAYRAARRGETVALAPRSVIAYALRLVARTGAFCTITVECGKGYYVRALARDLGRALGVGAHISALRRTRVGPFEIARALPLTEVVARLERAHPDDLAELLHAPDAVIAHWPAIILDTVQTADIRLGRRIVMRSDIRNLDTDARIRAYGADGRLEALVRQEPDDAWRPVRVFAPETS